MVPVRSSGTPKRFARVRSLIQAFFSELPQSSSLKGVWMKPVAHMSPSYLSHIFSKATGFSLWDYIIARRIEQAKHLLLSTDRKILDIAFECGFQNSVHFHKCFRSQTGLTPGEYREK